MTYSSKISSKFQVVIPADIRKKLNIKPNMELVWIELKPGDFAVGVKEKMSNEEWIEEMCGIIEDNSWDSLEELKKYKGEDKLLEKRKYDSA